MPRLPFPLFPLSFPLFGGLALSALLVLQSTGTIAQGVLSGLPHIGADIPLAVSGKNPDGFRNNLITLPPELRQRLDPEASKRKSIFGYILVDKPETLALKPALHDRVPETGDLVGTPDFLKQKKERTSDDVIAEIEEEARQPAKGNLPANPVLKKFLDKASKGVSVDSTYLAPHQDMLPQPGQAAHHSVPVNQAMNNGKTESPKNDSEKKDDKKQETSTSTTADPGAATAAQDDSTSAQGTIEYEQVNITQEQLLAEYPPPSPYVPGREVFLVTGALAYGLIRATGADSNLFRGGITAITFTLVYFADLMRRVANTPEGYFEQHGVLTDAVSSVVADLFAGGSAPAAWGKVMQNVNLTALFGHFCRAHNATEQQHSTFFRAFYLGIMLAWSSHRMFDTDSEELDRDSLSRKWILVSAHRYLKNSSKVKRNPEKAFLVWGDELQKRFKEPSREAVVLTTTGDLEQAKANLVNLPNGFYTVQGMRIIMLVDDTRVSKKVIMFYPFMQREMYFTSREDMATYLYAVNSQLPVEEGLKKTLILYKEPLVEFSRLLFFGGELEEEQDENDETLLAQHAAIMELEPNKLPDLDGLTHHYRKLAKERHPDKKQGSTSAHDEFTTLQSAYAFLKTYLEKQESEGEETDD